MAPLVGDGIMGNLFCRIDYSCPSGIIKTQKVHIPLFQLLGIKTGGDVVHGSSKVLTSLT